MLCGESLPEGGHLGRSLNTMNSRVPVRKRRREGRRKSGGEKREREREGGREGEREEGGGDEVEEFKGILSVLIHDICC